MTFINLAMLLGLAGTAIPVLVHLIGRRAPPSVEFPAIRFLVTQLTVQRRRLNIQRWALLLLRMAMIALVVLALAQPRITGRIGAAWVSLGGLAIFGAIGLALAWIAWSGKARKLSWGLLLFAVLCLFGCVGFGLKVAGSATGPLRSSPAEAAVGIVLDNSVRMQARDRDRTRLDRATEMANWLLDEFPVGSRIAIFDRTSRPVTFALDHEAARRTITSIEPIAVEETLEQRIEAAVRLLRSSELPYRSIYVITDLTRAGWDASAAGALAALFAEEPKVSIQFIDVGSENTENWRLENVQVPPLPLASGVPGQISANIVPPETLTTGETQVELALYAADPSLPVLKGGQLQLPSLSVVDRQTVRMGENLQAVLNLPPLDPGSYRGVLRIDVGDDLALDNQVPWSIEVAIPPKILIVGRDPNERRVMSYVLSDPDSPAPEYLVTTIDPSGIAQVNLTDFDAAIWIDPEELTGPLAVWGQGGGKLLVSLGPSWRGDNKLPGLAINLVRKWKVPDPGTYFEIVQPDHPALLNLSDGNVSWPQYPVRIYWLAELGEGMSSPVRMAGTGAPALIDAPWGSGRLILLTTHVPGAFDSDTAWNQLLSGTDAWPTWLLLRQTMNQLGRADVGTLNINVGSPVILPQRASDPARYQLFSPGQEPVPIEATGDALVPGSPFDVGLHWLKGEGGTRTYAAKLASGQTEMRRLAKQQLDSWFGTNPYSIVTTQEEVTWESGSGAGSQPLYAQAMLAAVLIWLLEHTLANKFYQRK